MDLYLEHITKIETCLDITVRQSFVVHDVKNAMVEVYEYYRPGELVGGWVKELKMEWISYWMDGWTN